MTSNNGGNSSEKPRIRAQAVLGDQKITKVSNIETPVSRLRLGEIGYSGLRAISDYVDQEMVRDLRWPTSLTTFDKMSYDSSVFIGMYLSQILVEKAFNDPRVLFNKDSEASKEAAEFIKWNLNNMTHSLQEAMRDAYSCKKYGFSVLVKNYEQITSGKYRGKFPYKIKRLSPRSQKTLNKSEPFVVSPEGDIVAVRQDTRSVGNSFGLFTIQEQFNQFKGQATVNIPRQKFMLFSYNSVNGNPLGSSALRSAYKPWKEKILMEDYEMVGITKDLGG